jgi:hypothetical protein
MGPGSSGDERFRSSRQLKLRSMGSLGALDAAMVKDRLVADGFELEKMSPEELTIFIRAGLDKWGPLAKRLMSVDAAK